jgi:hypothetical protein
MGIWFTHVDDAFFLAQVWKEAAYGALRCAVDERLQEADHFEEDEQAQRAETLAALLWAYAWRVQEDHAGNVVRMEFRGNRDHHFGWIFEALAPYVRGGSYIICYQENWVSPGYFTHHWTFDGNAVKEELRLHREPDSDPPIPWHTVAPPQATRPPHRKRRHARRP